MYFYGSVPILVSHKSGVVARMSKRAKALLAKQTHRHRRYIGACEHDNQGIEESSICIETHTSIAQKNETKPHSDPPR